MAIRQDMAPKGGYAPIHWKRYAPKRTVPGYFLFSTWVGLAAYSYYKFALVLFEQRVNIAHGYHIKKSLYPFLWAEEDRRMVRARKQHEEDLKLIGGSESEWDCNRRTFAQEELFVPYSSREVRVLLTDEERVALGGEPSRYSVNDLWQNYSWQIDHHEDKQKLLLDTPSRNAGTDRRELE